MNLRPLTDIQILVISLTNSNTANLVNWQQNNAPPLTSFTETFISWMVYPSNMDKKKIVVGIVVVVIVAAALYGSTQMYGGNTIEATLTIENGGTMTYSAELTGGSNVFDLMKACNVPFEEDGGFVTSINNISQDTEAGKYWIYYINGESALVGAGDYIVQEGDHITWRLESF
jgi:hypothetical protein